MKTIVTCKNAENMNLTFLCFKLEKEVLKLSMI